MKEAANMNSKIAFARFKCVALNTTNILFIVATVLEIAFFITGIFIKTITFFVSLFATAILILIYGLKISGDDIDWYDCVRSIKWYCKGNKLYLNKADSEQLLKEFKGKKIFLIFGILFIAVGFAGAIRGIVLLDKTVIIGLALWILFLWVIYWGLFFIQCYVKIMRLNKDKDAFYHSHGGVQRDERCSKCGNMFCLEKVKNSENERVQDYDYDDYEERTVGKLVSDDGLEYDIKKGEWTTHYGTTTYVDYFDICKVCGEKIRKSKEKK